MPDCNIAIAAKRIVWGKFTNAGQACVAPDYLLVHLSIKKFMAELERLLMTHFRSSSTGENFIAIENDNQFECLKRLIDPDGDVTNIEQRFISPTILHA
jgi:aldehyde dehydrogenase (NAD+)